MLIQASLNQNDMSGVVRMSLRVAKYTAVVEGVLGTALALRFYQQFGLKGIYYGYWHAISAFCNAGFDLLAIIRALWAMSMIRWSTASLPCSSFWAA